VFGILRFLYKALIIFSNSKNQPEKAAQKLRAFPHNNFHKNPHSAAGAYIHRSKARFGGVRELCSDKCASLYAICISKDRHQFFRQLMPMIIIAIHMTTTIADEGMKQATSMPKPKNIAAIAVHFGRIFMPDHPFFRSLREALAIYRHLYYMSKGENSY
jgi:hypothetical protein